MSTEGMRLLGLAGPLPETQRPFALPGDTPHYPKDRTVDFIHTRLDLALDFDRSEVSGSVTHTIEPLFEGIRSLELDAVEMDVEAVTVRGQSAEFSLDDTHLRLRIEPPLATGERADIAVTYRCRPRRGLYFIQPDDGYPDKPRVVWTQGQDTDSRYWFPCFDHTHERFTSEMTVTVPSKMYALSNGELLETAVDEADDTKTFHWRESVPHAAYLLTLVAGELSEIREEVDGIEISYYCVPGREDDVRRGFGGTPAMMRLFRERIGIEYPYEKYAQAIMPDFIFGGMENASATTQTDRAALDERAALDHSSDWLAAHELAHQWFGDLWTCRDWSHGWLNEGFATFFENYFTEHDKGWDEYAYQLLLDTQDYLEEDGSHYRRPIVTSTWRQPIDIFDRHLYEKGGLVLNSLRHVLGEDLFWKSLRHYATSNVGKNVVTSDLQRAITEATGRNIDWFFDEYVYGGGHPEFAVSWEWDDDGLARVKVEQTQAVDELTKIFRVPVDIAFHVGDEELRFSVEITEKAHLFSFRLPGKPEMVRFDPGNWILKTLDFKKPVAEETHQLRHDPDVIGRIRAARALGKKATPAAVAALRETVLGDAFWAVRAESAKALGEARGAQARDALLEALVSVDHPKVRRQVVAALGRFREDAVVDALIPVATSDASYFVEASATKALGQTRSPRAFDAIVAQLEKNSWAQVIRAHAFEGLAELQDERAIPVLKEWTAYGRPPQAREAATTALGRFGEGRPEVIDHLVDLLDDPWFIVRMRAVTALEKAKDPRAIPALRILTQRELDGRVVRRAREVIKALGAGNTTVADLRRLGDDIEKLRDENRGLRDRIEKLEALER